MTASHRCGTPFSIAVVPGRDDLLLEEPVQVLRVAPVLGRFVRVCLPTADRPAVVTGEPLVPPAVEDAHVRHAVLGGLHAGGPRRLQRPARVVEPDVHALHEEPADAHVVVLENVDATAQLAGARALEDLLDDPLARSVGRVGLAREHDLDRPRLVPQHPRQPVDVAEEQAGPLVRRKPAGEADREDSGSRASSSSASTDGASP